MTDQPQQIRDALNRVAKIAIDGSLRDLAVRMGLSTQALYKFCKEGGVPLKRAIQLSMWTKGQVPWYELAPNVLEELQNNNLEGAE